jgi:hypothetical protein
MQRDGSRFDVFLARRVGKFLAKRHQSLARRPDVCLVPGFAIRVRPDHLDDSTTKCPSSRWSLKFVQPLVGILKLCPHTTKTVPILFSECRDKEQQRGEENSSQDAPLPETEQASHDQHAYDFAFTVMISSQATAL